MTSFPMNLPVGTILRLTEAGKKQFKNTEYDNTATLVDYSRLCGFIRVRRESRKTTGLYAMEFWTPVADVAGNEKGGV